MTDKQPTAGEQPADLTAFAADTALLDALGNGEPAPPGDRVASLLAAWRADLDTDLPAAGAHFSVDAEPAADPEVARLIAAAGVHPPQWADRSHRMARRVLGAAAAVLAVAGGGLVVGAAHATPDSPLWPITKAFYREQADSAQAEHTLALARTAATQGRVADARRLLAQADALIARVSDPERAKRLRAESKAVRDLLAAAPGPTAAGSPAAPAPTPTGAVGGPAAPPTGGAPQPTPTTPQPKTTTGGAPLLPPLGSVTSPGLPLPSLPPSLGPLPLPLPTGLLPKAP